jgi:polysaccharide biosynthesis/export protein
LRNDITVTEAIAVAGGFTPQAKTQVFLYRRVSPGWVQVRRLNLKEILNGKNVNEDARMQEGDMVFVPEKFITNFRKYVPYSVGMYLNPASIL